jgi:hypothetical protein
MWFSASERFAEAALGVPSFLVCFRCGKGRGFFGTAVDESPGNDLFAIDGRFDHMPNVCHCAFEVPLIDKLVGAAAAACPGVISRADQSVELVLIEGLFFDIAAHLSFGFGNAPRELGINLGLPFPLPAIVFSPLSQPGDNLPLIDVAFVGTTQRYLP